MFKCQRLISQICRSTKAHCILQPIGIRRLSYVGAVPCYWTKSQRTVAKNPLRCVHALSDEHIRIKSTLQAFDKMLDKISEDPADEIPSHYVNDLDKFMEFSVKYGKDFHEPREEILYEKIQKKPRLFFDFDFVHKTQDIIEELEDDHIYGQHVYAMMQQGINARDKHSFVLSAKSFIHLLYDHIAHEDKLIYPKCIQNLSEQELEDISQTFDDLDEKNNAMLNKMIAISDDLQNKYHPYAF